jgi:hypothetical protein
MEQMCRPSQVATYLIGNCPTNASENAGPTAPPGLTKGGTVLENGGMGKWTKTRRGPGRTYQHDEEARRLRNDIKRIRELIREAAEGNLEAEPEYVAITKKLEPEMSESRRQRLIRQFRDAVADQRQRRGLYPR